MTIGTKLREQRIQRSETLHQVSVKIDIDSTLLSKIERGERLPTIEQLKKLSHYIELTEVDLKVMHTAEKIILEYGINEATYEAIRMVEEKLSPYIKKNKSK